MPQTMILPMPAHCWVSEVGPVQLQGAQEGSAFQMEAICKQVRKLSKFKEKDQVLRLPPAFHSFARQNAAATMESCLCSLSFAVVSLRLLLWGDAVRRSTVGCTQTCRHCLLVLFYTILKFAVRRLHQHFYF